MSLQLVLQFSLLFLSSAKAIAAACCGSGVSSAAVLTGENRAQMSVAYSSTEVVVDSVDNRGVWRSWDVHPRSQVLRLEGAHIFADRWQVGAATSAMDRERLGEHFSGLGDLAFHVGYEYLPDWDYNPWRPKGVGYLQVNVPTGKSKTESDLSGLDSRGSGFKSLGLGNTWTKSWVQVDAMIALEAHYSMAKPFSNSQGQGTLRPGWGINATVGMGYNWQNYRVGWSLSSQQEDPIRTELDNGEVTMGEAEKVVTAALQISYFLNEEWSGTFALTDQTLFGDPRNTSLAKGALVQIQKHWAR